MTIAAPGTPAYEKTLDKLADGQKPDRSLSFARWRQGLVVATDAVSLTCSVQLDGDTTQQTDGVSSLMGYIPQVNDNVWCIQNNTDLIVVGTQANPPAGLAKEVNDQFWTSTIAHNYTTSWQFIGSSQTITIVKRFRNTKIIGRLALGFRTGAAVTVNHALYETSGFGGDSIGEWEICRVFADTAQNHAKDFGAREMGVPGRYPPGSLTFAIAGMVSVNTTVTTDANDSWTIEIEECW